MFIRAKLLVNASSFYSTHFDADQLDVPRIAVTGHRTEIAAHPPVGPLDDDAGQTGLLFACVQLLAVAAAADHAEGSGAARQ